MNKILYLQLLMLLASVPLLNAQCYPERHSTDWFDAWVSCDPSPSPIAANGSGHWILYDLQERYNIDRIKVWNINDPSHLGWGIRDCKVQYSGNQVDWFDGGTLRLEKGSGLNNYEGMEWMDIRLPEARYILITAINNFEGSACFGLAEVAWSAEKTVITNNEDRRLEGVLEATISPNPAHQYFIAEINTAPDEEIRYSCSDLLGRTLSVGQFTAVQGRYLLKIYTDQWPTGQYQLLLRSASATITLPVFVVR